MKNKPEIINFEKTLEILDILGNYIDGNNEIKPEFFQKIEPIIKCLSIFSGLPIEKINTDDVLKIIFDFDTYIKINQILEANKMFKRFRMRQ